MSKTPKIIKKSLKILLYFFLTLFVVYYFYFEYPLRGTPFRAGIHGNPPLTPRWALECWLWEDDDNTAERVDYLLQGYARHDIPVRTILLDSPWSMRYNDFEVDTILYPNPTEWFAQLKDDGYRIVLWMTTMVNSRSKDTRIRESEDWFDEAKEKGYLAGNGNQIRWWKGRGGFIDYSNPEALAWWQGMQQQVFDLGIDGWKLDGTATLWRSMFGPIPLLYQRTHKGIMTTRTYMNYFYRTEYFHGLTQNPEFITLARSYDRWFHPEGFAPLDAAPVTWVGDQTHTWESTGKRMGSDDFDHGDIAMDGIEGIELALKNIMKAAKIGYNIIGSDIGGFAGGTIPPRLYIRWTQLSTFCGLFLNGGHGERALWNRSQMELEIIRKFSWLNNELIPYKYSYVVSGHHGGKVLQRPVKGKYHYMFGDDFLIAPIYKDQLSNQVNLPKGKWRYFFDDDEVVRGPKKFERDFPLDEFPVYIREGAIVPMDIKRDYTGIGDENSDGFFTILIYPYGNSSFNLYHTNIDDCTVISASDGKEKLVVGIEGKPIPHILNIKMSAKPKKVELDGVSLTENEDYRYDHAKKRLIVTSKDKNSGQYAIHK